MVKRFNQDTIGTSYAKELQAQHRGSDWGSTGARYSGFDVLSLLRDRPYLVSVLDYGAGKGSMGRFIEDELGRSIEWTNYDPGIPEYDQLPNKQFDLVMSTDVLEHVEPDKLVGVIKTLGDLTGKVLFSDIACYLTGTVFGSGPYVGQDLHISVKRPDVWRELFDWHSGLQEFEYHHRERRTKGTMRERCVMIHERV